MVARGPFSTRIQQAVVVYSYNDEERAFKMTHEFLDFTARCIGVAFGPFDTTVISRHDDGSIIVWDLETDNKVLEKKIHEA